MQAASSLELTPDYFFLALEPATASFSLLPTLNLATFLAGIFSSLPVAGLRPTRAARDSTAKVPKPTSCTLSPLTSEPCTVAISAFSTSSTPALLCLVDFATASISSALFILFTPLWLKDEALYQDTAQNTST